MEEEPVLSFRHWVGKKRCFVKVFTPGGDLDRPPHAVRVYTEENGEWVLASELQLPTDATEQSALAAGEGELLRLAKEGGWGPAEPTSAVTMAADLENVEIEDFIIQAHQRAREELRRARRPHAKHCLVVDARGRCTLMSRKELALRYANDPEVGRQIADVSASPYNFDELPVLRERADGTTVAFLMDSFCGAASIQHVDVAPSRRNGVAPLFLSAALPGVFRSVEEDHARGRNSYPYDFVVHLDWSTSRWDVIDRVDYIRSLGALSFPLARAVKASVGCLVVFHSEDGGLRRISVYGGHAVAAMFIRFVRDREARAAAVPRGSR